MYEDTPVTDMNTMLNLTTTKPQAAASQPSQGQKSTTLSDFVGMLLAPEGQAQDANALQNMPQNLKALAEKIAATLNGSADAEVNADIDAAADNSDIPAGLTSDLSAMLVNILQNAEGTLPAEDISADAAAVDAALMPQGIDMQALAGMLNGMEPGAAADDAAAAAESSEGIDAEAMLMQMMSTRKGTAAADPLQNKEAPLQKAAAEDMPAPAPDAKQSSAKPLPQEQAPQQPAAAAGAQAQQGAAKTDTALQALLAAMTPESGSLNAGGLGNGTGGGLGQGGFGQQGFGASGDIAFGGMTASGQTSFTQYMNTGATAQALPSQTSEMIAVQIQRNAAAKVDTFTLQLDPADLGRMDIELKFNHDGSLKAHLTVERPETLALLQKDASHLERVLQQSGLNTDGQSLSFDLRQQSGGQEKRDLQTGSGNFGRGSITGAAETNDNATDSNTARGYIGPRGVDIRV